MNIHDPNIATPKVTTGPLPASRKVYARPDTAPDLRVPVREIVLTDAAAEPPVPVYDTTGPYTDPDVTIDVEKGLNRTRAAWVRERGGVEEYDGRPIQPVDNGNVSGKHLARNFPATPRPMRASPSRLWGRSASEASRGGGRSESNNGCPPPPPSPTRGEGARGRASGGEPNGRAPLTQLEWARAGVITKEMIYIAA